MYVKKKQVSLVTLAKQSSHSYHRSDDDDERYLYHIGHAGIIDAPGRYIGGEQNGLGGVPKGGGGTGPIGL